MKNQRAMTSRSRSSGEAEVVAADQPQRVAEEQRVLGGDHLRAAEPAREALQELMPVGEVEDLLLRGREPLELPSRRSALDLTGLEVLASQHVVDVLEPRPAEGQSDADAQHLVGLGSMYGFFGFGAGDGRRLAARLKSSSSRRPFSQWTDIRVRMKSAWFSLTPSELIRTKISATCSSSAMESAPPPGTGSHEGRGPGRSLPRADPDVSVGRSPRSAQALEEVATVVLESPESGVMSGTNSGLFSMAASATSKTRHGRNAIRMRLVKSSSHSACP